MTSTTTSESAVTRTVASVRDKVRALIPDHAHAKPTGPLTAAWTWTTVGGVWRVTHTCAPLKENTLALASDCVDVTLPADETGVAALRAVLEAFNAIPPLTAAARCPSCEHTVRGFHGPAGCWYSPTVGTVGENSVCRCSVPREDDE